MHSSELAYSVSVSDYYRGTTALRLLSAITLCTTILLLPYCFSSISFCLCIGFILFLTVVFMPKVAHLAFYLSFTIPEAYGLATMQQPMTIPSLGSVTYSGIMAICYVAATLIALFMHSPGKRILSRLRKVNGLMLFLGFSASTVTMTIIFHFSADGLKGTLFYLVPVAIYLNMSLYMRQSHIRTLLFVLIASLVSVVIRVPYFMIIDRFVGMTKGNYTFMRCEPDALSAVDYSLLIAALLPAAFIAYFYTKNKFGKFMAAGLFIASSLAIIPFWARASLVSASFIIALQFFLRGRSRIGVFVIVIFILIVGISPAKHLIFDIVDSGVTDSDANTFADRLWNLWIPALSGGLPSLIVGIGPRSLGNFFFNARGEYLTAIHSIYLNILLESGLLALALFLASNYQILTRWLKEIRQASENAELKGQFVGVILPAVIYLFGASTSTASFNLFYSHIFVFLAFGNLLKKGFHHKMHSPREIKCLNTF